MPRTLKAIAALKIVLELLVDARADVHFQAELEEILSYLPLERQPGARRRLWETALQHSPFNHVAQIRKAKPSFIARQIATKQLPVHPSTSDDSR